MKIETTYDEVLHAAVMGFEPDDADLARVKVPFGEDAADFSAAVRAVVLDIVQAKRAGMNDEARRLAAEAKGKYDAAFEALRPNPAGQEPEAIAAVAERIFRR